MPVIIGINIRCNEELHNFRIAEMASSVCALLAMRGLCVIVTMTTAPHTPVKMEERVT